MKLSPSLRTPATVQRDSAPRETGLHHKVRECLNRIVTICELLKMDAEMADERKLASPFDQVRAEAMSLFQVLQSVLFDETGAPIDLSDPILAGTQALHQRIQEIQAIARSGAQTHLAEDLLELEMAVYQFLKMVRQAGDRSPYEKDSDQAASPALGHSQAAIRNLVLIADDDALNRDLLGRILAQEHHELLFAGNGQEVLSLMRSKKVDMVLLDLVMPGASGFEVLRATKAVDGGRHIPVVVLSGVDDIEQVAACIEMGADDYLLKPFNATLLRARVRALLERKHQLDSERAQAEKLENAFRQLEAERRTTELLLLNVLPKAACQELRDRGSVSPTYFEDVTIVFTDFVGFTASTEKLTADELVSLLNEYFTAFDNIVDGYGLEKLKTVGDSYVFLAGLPERTPSHPVDAVLASMEMLQFVKSAQQERPNPGWSMRIGMHNGSVIAGVVGKRKFAFDVWGDAVNFASRMVSSGASNRINVSERAYQRLKDFFSCTPRGLVDIKGNRKAEMYFVDHVHHYLMQNGAGDTAATFRERYNRYFRRELRRFPAKF